MDDRQKRQRRDMENLLMAEHLKSKITEVHYFFADVVECLMQAHEHLTIDVSAAKAFTKVMAHVPKNSRDVRGGI